MSGIYPAAFEIEIDREPLARYLRGVHRQMWFLFMVLVGGFAGFVAITKYIEGHAALPWAELIGPIGWRPLWIGVTCLMVGVMGYGLSVRTIAAYVDSLLLAVDGNFLRVRKTVAGIEQDRKFHFNLLQIYSTQQNARMKRLGIMTLVITTSVGVQANRTIEVPAVKDCLKVRDLLAEIDSEREKGQAAGPVG